jgi:hypothetical protein
MTLLSLFNCASMTATFRRPKIGVMASIKWSSSPSSNVLLARLLEGLEVEKNSL